MTVHVTITEGSLPDAPRRDVAGAGATVVFEGTVRPEEDGHTIAGLDYQDYQPMAGDQLHKLAERTSEDFNLLAIHVEHSRGFVPIGEVSFRLTLHAEHRKEALAATEWFIDTMKRDVPIWKSARDAE
jgi:molybdopterin synthase catalytic subunit